MIELTKGAIAKLMEHDKNSEDFRPILKVTDLKFLNPQNPTGERRCRVVLSDGTQSAPGVLKAELNSLVDSGQLENGSTVRIINCVRQNMPNGKEGKFLYFSALEVLSNAANSATAMTGVTSTAHQQSSSSFGQPRGGAQSGQFGATSPMGNRNQAPAPSIQLNAQVVPVNNLNPYLNKWTVLVRVTSKSEMKTYHGAKGDGRLFSVEFADKDGGEIRATAFNDAADRLFALLQQDQVYLISNGMLKPANKQYSNSKNPYEMTLNQHSVVEPAPHLAETVGTVKYSFVPIQSLADAEKDAVVDVIGVVSHVNDVNSITAKSTGRTVAKRTITLVDTSGYKVEATLWGNMAEQFDGSNAPVLAVKGAKVSDFGGKTLSVSTSSKVQLNPDIQEAHRLRGWYDSGGANQQAASLPAPAGPSGGGGGAGGLYNLAQRKPFFAVKEENLGMSEKPDYLTVRGTVTYVRKSDTTQLYYPACPNKIGERNCSKKVINTGVDWRCESCQKNMDKPEYRYIFSVTALDHTGSSWLSGFNESGEVMFEHTADSLQQLAEQDKSQFDSIVDSIQFKTYIFRLRIKSEMVNSESRVKCTILSVEPVDYAKESRLLIEAIQGASR